eukprot:436938-Prymnesium_polylepis.1
MGSRLRAITAAHRVIIPRERSQYLENASTPEACEGGGGQGRSCVGEHSGKRQESSRKTRNLPRVPSYQNVKTTNHRNDRHRKPNSQLPRVTV